MDILTSRDLTQRAFREVATQLGVYNRSAIFDGVPVWTPPARHVLNTSLAIVGQVGEVGLFWDHDACSITAPEGHEIWAVVDSVVEALAQELIPWSDLIRAKWVNWLLDHTDQVRDEDVLTAGTYTDLYELMQSLIPGGEVVDGVPIRDAFVEVTTEAEAILEPRNAEARQNYHFDLADQRARAMGIGTASYHTRRRRPRRQVLTSS